MRRTTGFQSISQLSQNEEEILKNPPAMKKSSLPLEHFRTIVESIKEEMKGINPSDFYIESSEIYNFLDARIIFAKKAKEKVFILKPDQFKSYAPDIKIALDSVSCSNPSIRVLVTGKHWTCFSLNANFFEKVINILWVDSTPMVNSALTLASNFFSEIQDYFKLKSSDISLNFFYSIEELQKDFYTCASYAVHTINNLFDIEKYIDNYNIFEYLKDHIVQTPDEIQNIFFKKNITIAPVLIPLKLTLTKQSLNKDESSGKRGLFFACAERKNKDKKEFSSKNKKGISFDEVIADIKLFNQARIYKKNEKMYRIIEHAINNISGSVAKKKEPTKT